MEAHFIRIYCQLYTPNYQKIFLQTVAYVRCIDKIEKIAYNYIATKYSYNGEG